MLQGWAGAEQRVPLTVYTDAYVARGTLATRQHRLSDILNFAEEDFLVLADATFERFGRRGPIRQAAFAQVNLSAVLFAVADTTVEAVPELRTPKIAEVALISIPPFEIVGRIHLLPERDLRQALQELTGRFIPVTDATYGSDVAGEPSRTAPMVAVNHARAQILSPYESDETASSGGSGATEPGFDAE
ncbi:MAG TPA: hypothetical protein VF971_02305 [Candidatus Limnocylindrales bacterium]|jgi:hypothetical protein